MDRELVDARIEYIKVRLDEIKEYLKKYDENKGTWLEDVLLSSLERKSEAVIESAININNELLKLKKKTPLSYFDSFSNLKVFNIFDDEFLLKISNTAGFRNRLAHEYMNLDDKITIKSIKQILNLYPRYLLEVVEFLEYLEK